MEWDKSKDARHFFHDSYGEAFNLPNPMPDFAAYFPVYVSNEVLETRGSLLSRHPLIGLNRHSFSALSEDECYTNFQKEILLQLHAAGLTPMAVTLNQEVSKADSRMGYPWFVCEIKKDAEDQESVYCRAANAASVALCMFENAARYEPNKLRQQHIPPLPVMTAFGEKVKIWVAYLELEHGTRYFVSRPIP